MDSVKTGMDGFVECETYRVSAKEGALNHGAKTVLTRLPRIMHNVALTINLLKVGLKHLTYDNEGDASDFEFTPEYDIIDYDSVSTGLRAGTAYINDLHNTINGVDNGIFDGDKKESQPISGKYVDSKTQSKMNTLQRKIIKYPC